MDVSSIMVFHVSVEPGMTFDNKRGRKEIFLEPPEVVVLRNTSIVSDQINKVQHCSNCEDLRVP